MNPKQQSSAEAVIGSEQQLGLIADNLPVATLSVDTIPPHGWNLAAERLWLAPNSAQVGTWEWFLDTNQYYWSTEIWNLYGLTLHSCQPSYENWLQAIYPADRERVAAAFLMATTQGIEFKVEWRVNQENGTSVQWLMTRGRPICEAGGNITSYVGIVFDITDRKEAERAVRESEHIYRSLFKNLLNAAAYCRLLYHHNQAEDFVYLEVNEAFMAQTGLRDVVGRRASEIIPGIREQDPKLFEIFVRVIDTGRPERFEMHMVAMQQWISAAVYSPAPLHFVLVFDVITERKQTEARLQKLSQAVEQSPTSIVITNTAAEIEYINESFTRITGYTLEDVKGKNPRILQSGKTARADYSSLWQALTHGQPWQGEFINRRKNGELFIEYERFTPIRQPDGTITHYLSIKEDITTTKRLNQELDNYRHRLEELVDERTRQLQEANYILEKKSMEITNLYNNAPCGYHSLDMQGCYVAVNDTELAMLGYTREELIGKKNIHELMTSESQERFVTNARILLKNGRIRDMEYNLIRKDGSVLPVVINTDTISDANGNFLYSHSTLFDDTERKRREQQIVLLNRHYWAELAQRAEEAEAATRAKSAFLANMSHEIRTPMNAILGLTHLLQRGIVDNDHLDKLKKITNAAHHLLSIINGILDLSKIEAGRFQLEVIDFAVDEVFDKVISMVGPRLRDKGLTFTITRDDNLPAWLYGDPTRLSQLLLNYLDNAIKFTECGAVTLRTSVLEQEAEHELFIRFDVQDTGVGIEPDKCARIFSAFEQADNSITRRYGGTGLGLAINRRLAALMGGETGVESSPGNGSNFWFTARLRRGTEQLREETLDAEQILLQKYHGTPILVVEDNPINQEVIRELLEGVGLTVTLADDGSKAVAQAQQKKYDLVLMDVQMPVMNGLAATSAIRLLPGWEQIPILAMSANVFAEDRQQCLSTGMDDFVGKPVIPDALFTSLVRWLRKTKPESLTQVTDSSAAHVPPPPDTTLPVMPAVLANLTGLDTILGLKTQRGRVDTYLRLLHNFARYHQDDMTRVNQSLLRDERKNAQHFAHTLKGVAGNLGATALKIRAQQLEDALRRGAAGQEIDALCTMAETELNTLVAAILSVPLAPSAISQSITPEQTKKLFDQLEHLLVTNDYAGHAFFHENGQHLRVVLRESAAELEKLLERFEYEEALALVRGVRIGSNV